MRFRLRSLFITIALFGMSIATLRGCPTQSRLSKVQVGMTEAQVRHVMIATPNAMGRAREGRNYYWTWHRSFSIIGVLVVEFSPDGKVVDAFHEN